MTKHRVRSFSFILLSLFVLQMAAWADTIEGRVKHASSQALEMVVYDAQGRPYQNTLNLKVDPYTQINGAPSAAYLRPNDAIGAEVRQEETGVWRADSITLFQQVNVKPATQKPSPSLRDALGNPVVKGALVGAATGAIASSASGGKAGKGALVGAGVGAAAGLLGQMFSQKSSSDQDNQ